MKITDLMQFARCGRKMLYDIFEGKDDCLQATLDYHCTSAHTAALDDRDHVRGLLDYLREHPSAARVIFLEGWRIDPTMMLFHLGEFTKLLRDEPTAIDEMRIGAAAHVIGASIRGGGVEQFPPPALINEMLRGRC